MGMVYTNTHDGGSAPRCEPILWQVEGNSTLQLLSQPAWNDVVGWGLGVGIGLLRVLIDAEMCQCGQHGNPHLPTHHAYFGYAIKIKKPQG